mgnify:CR=1 FL=1
MMATGGDVYLMSMTFDTFSVLVIVARDSFFRPRMPRNPGN